MPFSLGPGPSKATTPTSPSPASSRSNLRSGLTSILPGSSRRQKSPDEQTSLLGPDGGSRTPRRSWTADLDDMQGETEVETDRQGSTSLDGGAKDNDADGSSFTNSVGCRYYWVGADRSSYFSGHRCETEIHETCHQAAGKILCTGRSDPGSGFQYG
jgi:hypothetical protein